jgi:polyisoprenoid-binding protein YceI
MKKISTLILAIAAVFYSFIPSSSVNWKLDPVHSNLNFAVGHLGVSEITGTVHLNKATISAPDSTSFTGATVTLEADMNTINTGNEKRDAHLRTPDFFDAAKFPTLTFQSSSFMKVSGDNYQINGNLTLHGITKPVTLSVILKTANNPVNDKPITGCRVSGKIKRSDFEISKSTPEAILDDVVNITANLEFAKE